MYGIRELHIRKLERGEDEPYSPEIQHDDHVFDLAEGINDPQTKGYEEEEPYNQNGRNGYDDDDNYYNQN